MTRDQAIQLLGNVRVPWQRSADIMQPLVDHPDRWIEAFESLGMLKLDEPKDAWTKFREMMEIMGHRSDSQIWKDIHSAIVNARLKIVDQ